MVEAFKDGLKMEDSSQERLHGILFIFHRWERCRDFSDTVLNCENCFQGNLMQDKMGRHQRLFTKS